MWPRCQYYFTFLEKQMVINTEKNYVTVIIKGSNS